MEYDKCVLCGLDDAAAKEISLWKYDEPYDAYSYAGRTNGYLMDRTTWGKEQYYLKYGEKIVMQASCQFSENILWVGWSLAPEYCGRGQGHLFIGKFISEIRKITNYTGTIRLRVAARNKRAIRAYEKAGFVYSETIQDEIAYTNVFEDFWVMERGQLFFSFKGTRRLDLHPACF